MGSEFEQFIRQFYERHGIVRSEQEIREAAANFAEYMRVIRRIYERLATEGRLGEVRALFRAQRERQLKRELVDDLCILLMWRAEQKIRVTRSVVVEP